MVEGPTATVLAALISGVIGTILGGLITWVRFKRERAFDRKIDWYERAIRALYSLSQRIEVALTHHADPTTEMEVSKQAWREVQKAHLVLDRTCMEALLFGSKEAIAEARRISDVVQKVADSTNAFDPHSIEVDNRPEALTLIDVLPDQLVKSAEPLALEGRRHLGLQAHPFERLARTSLEQDEPS